MAHVQSRSVGGSGSSLSLAYLSNTTAGNLLVAGIGTGNSGVITISVCTDTQGNTWIETIERGSNGTRAAIQYVENCPGGANTVTANFSGGTTINYLTIAEYSGMKTSSVVDASAGAQGASATPSVNLTTIASNTLIVGVLTGTYTSLAAGANYTGRSSLNNSGIRHGLEDREVSSAGVYAVNFAVGSSFNDYGLVATSFKMATTQGKPVYAYAQQ